jgi:hypothetical protein
MGPVRANYIVQLIAAFLTGCFVGTFVGLATSPVAHLVISALIGLCAAATAAIAGVQPPNDAESKPEQPKLLFKFHNAQVDFIPITLLAAGLLTGSCVGVVVRTNDVLGMHPEWISARWKHSTKLDDKDIARRLFDQAHPPVSAETPKQDSKISEGKEEQKPGGNSALGIIFSWNVKPEDCHTVRGTTGRDLRIKLGGLADDTLLHKIEHQIKDDKDLDAAVELICSKEN